MRSLVLLGSQALLRCSVLMIYLAPLTCSAFGDPKFTFVQALNEGGILILLISIIYTAFDENKGDNRRLSSRLRERG
jgi:hypothetical protein